jgi:glycosyltransferase involved in cell wall biosynthesis
MSVTDRPTRTRIHFPAAAPPERAADGWSVPDFSADVLRPRQSRYAVCLFVINEGERLLGQLAQMLEIEHGLDVIIADGGSTDGSTELRRLESLGVCAVLVKRGEGRLSAQMRMALAWCLREGYEGVIVMDGNGKDGPEALPRFVAALDAGFDHVQGSRFVRGGEAINTPLSRYLGIKLLHAPLISLAAGRRYTDTTNGFRGYSRKLLLDPRVAPLRDVFSKYELHYYMAIRAGRLGMRICEVPVRRAYPATGKTPTKIRGWRGSALILATLLRACLGRYNPGT